MTWSAWVADSLASGTLDQKTGHEIAGAINTFRMSYDYARGQAKVAELKRQLAELKKDKRPAGR